MGESGSAAAQCGEARPYLKHYFEIQGGYASIRGAASMRVKNHSDGKAKPYRTGWAAKPRSAGMFINNAHQNERQLGRSEMFSVVHE